MLFACNNYSVKLVEIKIKSNKKINHLYVTSHTTRMAGKLRVYGRITTCRRYGFQADFRVKCRGDHYEYVRIAGNEQTHYTLPYDRE